MKLLHLYKLKICGNGDCKIIESDINKTNGTLDGNHWKLERLRKYEGPDEFILTVDAWYSYEFGEGVISKLAGVNLMYSDGITSQTDTMFISNDTGNVTMPYIYLNGKYDTITNMGLVGTHGWGEGLSVVTVLPLATDVMDKNSNQMHIGHVVAPNAFVHNMNGDINGCIVSKSLDVNNRESHMWLYSGHRIKSNSYNHLNQVILFNQETHKVKIQETMIHQITHNQEMLQIHNLDKMKIMIIMEIQ